MILWRAAARGDVPAVVALLAEDWIGAASPDIAAASAGFDAMQADGGTRLFVGERDRAVVACYQLTLIVGLSLTSDRRAQLEGVRVRSDLRGQGIGAGLLADAEARARAAGATLIQLTSNARRVDARRFYERHGFTASHIGFKRYLD